MTIQEAYDRLTPIVAPIMNSKNDDERSMRDYELRKHIGIYIYFGELLKYPFISKENISNEPRF